MNASARMEQQGDVYSFEEQAQPAEPPRRRRWLSSLMWLLLVGLGGLLWAAPQIAGRYLVQQGLEVHGADNEALKIQFGETSLGWLSPVVLTDIVVPDLDGRAMLEVESLATERPLWQLVLDRQRPGRFIARHPQISVYFRDDGSSNIADVVRLLNSTPGTSKWTDIALTIESGQLLAIGFIERPFFRLDKIHLHASDTRATDRKLTLELTAEMPDEGESLPLEAGFEWNGAADADPFRSGKGRAAVKFAPLTLAVLATQLQRWIPDLDLHSGEVAGQMLADWDFAESQKVRAQGRLNATNVRATVASAPEGSQEIDWPSEQLAFDLDGDYSPESDSLLLSQATLQSTPVNLNAKGGISDLRGACVVDLRGELRLELDQFVNQLTADGREHVQVRGLQTRGFSIRGPLVTQIDGVATYSLADVALEADLGWEQADVFGVRSEQATLVARLMGGVLEFEPQNVPVSGGRFLGKPHVDLQVQPAQAEIPQGLVLENIQFSPEMCHLWMKYLSPPLAEAARAEGRFSIALSDTRFPIEDLATSEMQGVLSVHSAEIKPGPFANQIVGLVSAIEGIVSGRGNVSTVAGEVWIKLPPQEIAFHMANGRMHHASVEFHAGPVTIRSSGSVGLDETLDLMISVTLPNEWLKGPLVSDVLKGEIISIPVTGTFDRPQFDRRGLAEFGRRIATRATGGLLRKLLND